MTPTSRRPRGGSGPRAPEVGPDAHPGHRARPGPGRAHRRGRRRGPRGRGVRSLAGVVARTPSPTSMLVLCLAGIAAAAVATVRLWDWEGGPAVLAGSISTDRFGGVGLLNILRRAA